jgi:non-heme chloroperoxidase
MHQRLMIVASTLLAAFLALTPGLRAQDDQSPHRVQFIAVSNDVRLEVLDWGGSGRPVVLLAGLANTGHSFDQLAPKLAAHYRVYAITRRGLGASSKPDTGYDSDRLGDDVLAVIDSLALDRPVLVGHSRGCAELSSIGSRHPQKVAGLIYLDGGFGYAYYDPARGDGGLELADLSRKLEQLQWAPPQNREQLRGLIRELLDSDLPIVEKRLREYLQLADSVPAGERLRLWLSPALGSYAQKIYAGARKYTDIRGPVLAIYAAPHHDTPPDIQARDSALAVTHADGLKRAAPETRVVLLRKASHTLWETHEADVLREIRAFIEGLPRSRE